MRNLLNQKLYRSRTDRMIAGVCGGIANYFGIDPSIVRIIAAFLIIVGGVSFLIYLLLWAIVPLEPIEPKSRPIDIN